MKTLTTFLLSFTVAIASFGQKRSVDVGSFSEFSLGIPANVYLRQGSDEKVEIECDNDLFDKIEFELKGDELTIRKEGKWDWNDGWRRSEVSIYITMKTINELSVSGSGLIESDNKLNAEDLHLSVSGSGGMDLDLTSDKMDLRISGSGSIKLSGSANEAEAKISGSGRVKADELTAKIFEASISGSGSCYITVTEEVSANISGSGSVYYSGDPKRVVGNSSGSGKVRKM